MINVLIVTLAIALDFAWGEWQRWHPLVGFGRWANAVETWLWRQDIGSGEQRMRGVAALLLAVGPILLGLWVLSLVPGLGIAVTVLCLYWAIGARSLAEHATAVMQPLSQGDLEAARAAVQRIVSRDAQQLSEQGVARAAVESVLENGNDAVFGALFWFCVAGVPGVVLYRLVNTLDAMWGYRSERYLQFGWSAARLDDLLNWLPARLTALTYGVLGNARAAWRCWREQAPAWSSPNAGPVMAAGAGSLGVRIGGPDRYHGEWVERPWLGEGREPQAADIRGAVFLVQQGLALWFLVYFVVEALQHAT